MKHPLKLSVVIPMYNEASTIGAVLEKVMAVDLPGINKEIIVVDDGSTDNSLDMVHGTNSEDEQVIVVYASPVNLGKGAAVRCGFKFATGDIVLIQDADLELDPREYAQLLAPIQEGRCNVVYGSRFLARQNRVALKSVLANRFLTTLTNFMFGSKLTDMETAYKVFRRELLDDIQLRRVRFDFEPEFTAKLLKAGHTIVEVPVSYNPRTSYEGKKISWGDGLEAIWTIISCRFFE